MRYMGTYQQNHRTLGSPYPPPLFPPPRFPHFQIKAKLTSIYVKCTLAATYLVKLLPPSGAKEGVHPSHSLGQFLDQEKKHVDGE
jgi:hypothetical protein